MSQISRLRDAQISNGNLINADDLDAEFNQLVTESNSQDTRLTTLESGNATLTGTKTFGQIPILPASDPTQANQATRKAYVDARLPAGSVLPFAGLANPPSGFLYCDGQAVSRTTYADLFAALGTTYGSGDGSTTFNLPDLRGRAVIGLDNLGGTAANRITSASVGGSNAATLGGTGGSETHTLTISEMPAHTHSMANPSDRAGGGGGSTPSDSGSIATGSTGGGQAHSNTQPWMALKWIIRT